VNININKLQQKSLLNRMKSPMEELRRPLEPEDKVEISAKDKTEDGKIPLIISSQDRQRKTPGDEKRDCRRKGAYK